MPAQKAHEPAGTREREQRAGEPAQHAAVVEGAEEQGEQPRRGVQLPAVRVVEQPPHGPRKRGERVAHDHLGSFVNAPNVLGEDACRGQVPLGHRRGQDEHADGRPDGLVAGRIRPGRPLT